MEFNSEGLQLWPCQMRHFDAYLLWGAEIHLVLLSLYQATGRGSSCPPPVAGLLRCYSMKFCPFAQRACIILAAKDIKVLLGKVPSIELDGQVMIESRVICDYLDEAYPSPPLYPSDPWKKGHDRMLMELFNKVSPAIYKVYYARGDQKLVSQGLDDIRAGLDPLEAELKERNTKYFFGETPGMLDYMIWPWMERLPVVRKFAAEDTLPEDQFPKLVSLSID
ncbi:Pyrimidodiazepine synthase [Chionoecetes opilio]|uniref:Pyrimidodiazepine synthase n=1 Tax=Chionoecetes opilio TaxID=41210 RepID=A0A8J4XNK5_CHIOP|nr:Pyrimidodiazepine synthase [Chionoecetes opilio]